jgi:hypothetical protein
MLDPQTYLPDADHSRLISHSYWINDYVTGTFFSGPQLTTLLHNLRQLNSELSTSSAILPGIMAEQITTDWLDAHRMIIEEAGSAGFTQPLVQTIALSAEACRSNEQVAQLLEYVARYPGEGYYLVAEHPQGKYLVEDVAWIANVLDIVAGLKLLGSRVIVGYASHQMLIAAVAKADAICSGTWMNVRSFPPEKFRAPYEEEMRQRATWYYAAPALSEYKIPTLDGAQTLGLLSLLESPNASPEVAALFAGPQPTTIGLSERAAFVHYLNSLKAQAQDSVKDSFDETVAYYEQTIATADLLLNQLRASRITGLLRDFSLCMDANLLALEILKSTRGPLLRHNWATL